MENNIIEKRIAALTPEYRLFVESDFVENAAALFADSIRVSGRNIEIIENSCKFIKFKGNNNFYQTVKKIKASIP